MTLLATHYAVCNRCRALGPAAESRTAAWTAARAEGWTLRRSTVQHFCPPCVLLEGLADDRDREATAAAVRAVTRTAEVRSLRGGIRWPHPDETTPADPGTYPATIYRQEP